MRGLSQYCERNSSLLSEWLDGEVFVFRSDHPLEERIVVLTDDYRDERGDYLVPEAVAWDGVVTGWLER